MGVGNVLVDTQSCHATNVDHQSKCILALVDPTGASLCLLFPPNFWGASRSQVRSHRGAFPSDGTSYRRYHHLGQVGT